MSAGKRGAITRWLASWRALLRARDEIVGINRRNLELVYPHNPRRHYPIADDKLLCKEILSAHGVPVAKTLAVCDGLFAVHRVVTTVLDDDHFVVKPASGSGGDGIVVLGERTGPGAWLTASGRAFTTTELRKHLADIVFGAYCKHLEDRAFIERRVTPHPVYDALWSRGLCDLRVLMLEGTPLLAMVRVPTSRSGGRANLHQGGLGLAIDLETGRTTRAYSQGRHLETHPETGAPLVGVELPDWDAVLEIARATAAAVPLGYLGVDVVVDANEGPLVLEINARPGLEIQNVHALGLARARREALERAALGAGPWEDDAAAETEDENREPDRSGEDHEGVPVEPASEDEADAGDVDGGVRRVRDDESTA